jgi:hypothetical protein
MTENKLLQIGFDRFVKFSWAERALELAISQKELEAQRSSLKTWLKTEIQGSDAARKTFNVLTRMWLTEYPTTNHLRQEAMKFTSIMSPQERLVLHWGMSTANFRFFQDTAASVGNLLRLQGEFRSSDVCRRISETYSNQGTIPRSVNRLLQTFRDWEVITSKGSNVYIISKRIPVQETSLVAWLFEVTLNRDRERQYALADLVRLAELFPFDLSNNALIAIHNSSHFNVYRYGTNLEYVSICYD